MALIEVTMLVHVEDYSTSTDGSAICVRDYYDSKDGWQEINVLEWDERPMVAIVKGTCPCTCHDTEPF